MMMLLLLLFSSCLTCKLPFSTSNLPSFQLLYSTTYASVSFRGKCVCVLHKTCSQCSTQCVTSHIKPKDGLCWQSRVDGLLNEQNCILFLHVISFFYFLCLICIGITLHSLFISGEKMTSNTNGDHVDRKEVCNFIHSCILVYELYVEGKT